MLPLISFKITSILIHYIYLKIYASNQDSSNEISFMNIDAYEDFYKIVGVNLSKTSSSELKEWFKLKLKVSESAESRMNSEQEVNTESTPQRKIHVKVKLIIQ